MRPLQARLLVHRQRGDTWEAWSSYEVPVDLSEVLGRMQISNLEGRLDAERTKEWIRGRLPVLATALRDEEAADKILLASQWLLDGCAGSNELLSFVQTTVAMEILLGEETKSDVIGIGELLRNRCAYLIGKSRTQRDQILKDFDRIYKVRSRIVHRGKSHLTIEETVLLKQLRWMCGRVIDEEIKLIARDATTGELPSSGTG